MKTALREIRREELKAKKQAYVREELLRSAAELFAVRGYRAVTIDDIAANIGSAKSVVYYYFSSKHEILAQIFERIYDAYFETITDVAALKLGPEEALSRMIYGHAMNVMENREWTAIYHRDESELDDAQRKIVAKRRRTYSAMVQAVYKEGVKEGVFKDIPAEIAVNAIFGMCNWSYKWFDQNGKMSASDIANYYVTLLKTGYRVK